VAKKIPRSKRRELREQGKLKPLDRARKVQAKQQEKRAEEEAVVARVHDAHDAREEAPTPFAATTRGGRRDLTMLLVVALIGAAGVVLYLATRSPAQAEAPPAAATAQPRHEPPAPHPAIPPPPPRPAEPPAPPPPAPATAAPAPAPAAPATAAPAAAPVAHATAAPAPAKPAPAPSAKAAAPPPPAAPAAPKPKPKPAKAADDPYG